jgi:Protein of unknown function (DUF917)
MVSGHGLTDQKSWVLQEAAAAAVRAFGMGKLAAVMSGEVGGGNGVNALVIGARLGLPVVDGDFMGRAFPELQVYPYLPGTRHRHSHTPRQHHAHNVQIYMSRCPRWAGCTAPKAASLREAGACLPPSTCL